jgi:serine protease
MNRVICAALAAVVALAAAPAAAAPGNGNGAERVRVYVSYHAERRGPAQQALAAVGAELHYDFPGLRAFAASLPSVAVEALARNPAIEFVEEDPKRYLMSETVPYGIPMVQATEVTEGFETVEAANTVVCIIDSGLHRAHEDFGKTGQFSGTNDSGTGNWYEDRDGHGTHVAGTIAALGGNSKGVVGVAAAGILPVHIIKTFGDDGTWAYSSSLVTALQRCIDAKGNRNLVVNMSLGGSLKSRTEERAFNQAYAQGVLPVAAAGNDGNTRLSYPASYNSVVSVAAIDQAKVVAPFSQQNSQVELAAPGVNVLSTYPWVSNNSVSAASGTSAAEPIEFAATTDQAGVSAALADGARCTATNTAAWSGKVVLCERGDISFYDKVLNVQLSGGVAAVLYNNEPGGFLGTLGAGNTSTIPAVSIAQEDGQAMVSSALGQSATVVNTPPEIGSGYAFLSGTSMATPHVAGVAAVVWSHGANWSNQQIRDALAATAEDLGPGGRDNAYGFGLIRAKAALHSLTGGDDGAGDGGGGDEEPPPPPPPGDFTLSAVGYKVKGVQTVDLTWSGATSTSVDIYRGSTKITTANDGAYTDDIGAKGGGSYTYRVCEEGTTTTCSNEFTVVF